MIYSEEVESQDFSLLRTVLGLSCTPHFSCLGGHHILNTLGSGHWFSG